MNPYIQTLKYNAPAKVTPSAIKALDMLAEVAATHPDPELIHMAFGLLTASEPHRVADLMVSVRMGRTVDVVRALAVYWSHDRLEAHHKKIGRTLRSC